MCHRGKIQQSVSNDTHCHRASVILIIEDLAETEIFSDR